MICAQKDPCIINEYINICRMHDEEGVGLAPREQAEAFARTLAQAASATELYVVMGGERSGKSITVDLLAGKKLSLQKDQQFGMDVMVEQQNPEQRYPPVYVVEQKERTIIQCFTLDQNLTESKLQVLKLIYLEEYVKRASKLSIVIVFDAAMARSIEPLLEHFLHCIGITAQPIDHRTRTITQYVSFFITKTEGQAYEEVKEALQELRIETANQNIAAIIEHILDRQKIAQFEISDPSTSFAQQVRRKFTLVKYEGQLSQILKTSSIRSTQELLFSDSEQRETAKLYYQIASMVISLALYADNRAQSHKLKYESIAKTLFKLNHNGIDAMVGRWGNKELTAIAFDSSPQTDLQAKMNKQTSLLHSMLLSLEQKTVEAKLAVAEIKAILIFCSSLMHWLHPTFFRESLEQVIKQTEQLALQIKSTQKRNSESSPISPIIRRPPRKKPTPFSDFKQEVSYCASNKAALELCFLRIREKEGGDYFDVIYHIRLVMDVLQELNGAELGVFTKQLLEISLNFDKFHRFRVYLEQGIQLCLLDERLSFELIKKLLEHRRFQECESVIKYVQSATCSEETYTQLARLKIAVKKRSNEQFHSMHQDYFIPNTSAPKKLTFSIKEVQQKCQNSEHLRLLLQQSTFKGFLPPDT